MTKLSFRDKIATYLLCKGFIYEEHIKSQGLNLFLTCVATFAFTFCLAYQNYDAMQTWGVLKIIANIIIYGIVFVICLLPMEMAVGFFMFFVYGFFTMLLGSSLRRACRKNPEMISWSKECP